LDALKRSGWLATETMPDTHRGLRYRALMPPEEVADRITAQA